MNFNFPDTPPRTPQEQDDYWRDVEQNWFGTPAAPISGPPVQPPPTATRRPGTSPECPLRVATFGTSCGLLGDQQKNNNSMKKVLFRCNGYCFTHLLLFFTGKTNMQKF